MTAREPLTAAMIDELAKLYDAATTGEWCTEVSQGSRNTLTTGWEVLDGQLRTVVHTVCRTESDASASCSCFEDVSFIAAAKNAMPALLESAREVAKVKAELVRANATAAHALEHADTLYETLNRRLDADAIAAERDTLRTSLAAMTAERDAHAATIAQLQREGADYANGLSYWRLKCGEAIMLAERMARFADCFVALGLVAAIVMGHQSRENGHWAVARQLGIAEASDG